MEQSSNHVVGVDNTSRRKFDREEIMQRARERDEQEAEGRKSKSRGPPVQRKPLKPRDYQVDLESRLGKTQVVTPIAPLSQQAGYYCPVCECVVKDSANYLDHINGKKHQRALGMSMRVERSSLEQVQQRFESLKKRKDPGSFTVQDFDERLLKQQQEEEERKRLRREKKKEKKIFVIYLSLYPFPSLPLNGSAFSNKVSLMVTLVICIDIQKEKAAEEEPEMDPDVAAMMGFGGFKTSKK
ncbi:Zinc finger matrin-type protein 2 [Capsicum chinense]|nr:Zinc finger matrin-type protein 2 [Capsicum chinense]